MFINEPLYLYLKSIKLSREALNARIYRAKKRSNKVEYMTLQYLKAERGFLK